jgi:SAM-dependent methyltransferase
MALDPLGERWVETYRDAPEVFDSFSAAEDRAGIVAPAWIEAADLEGRRILELGCGTGRWTRELAPVASRYVALEPVPGMLARAHAAGPSATTWLRADARRLPFTDAGFERVLAAFVFANLRPRTREAALREARRVLSPGGELWLLENGGRDGYEELRREAGLEVEVEVAPLIDAGFEVTLELETEMGFACEEEAGQVLGQILGPRVSAALEARPRRGLTHRVCLLRESK